MPRFRKKPIEVEAHQWYQNGDHPLDEYERGTVNEGKLVRRYRTPDMDGQAVCEYCGYLMHDHGWIDTLEGGHIVCPGDWIITGIAGEHYPCKSDIFEQTYETPEGKVLLANEIDVGLPKLGAYVYDTETGFLGRVEAVEQVERCVVIANNLRTVDKGFDLPETRIRYAITGQPKKAGKSRYLLHGIPSLPDEHY